MAEEASSNESGSTEKKSSNLLMIIIIVVLVLIIILGAVAFLLLSGGEEVQQQTQEPQAQERSSAQTKRAPSSGDFEDNRKLSEIGVLYPLDTFTVNLKSDAGRRFLKVTMSLELDNTNLSLELDAKSPVIRDRVIRILTSKTLEEISSKKGKQKVSEQIMDTLNAMISDGKLKGIYFTEFVIQ